MPADNPGVIGQRVELFVDRTLKHRERTAHEIGATDGAREKHVADDRQCFVAAQNNEAHASGGVTGRVAHFELEIPDRYGVTVPQHQIGLRRRLNLESKYCSLLGRVAVKIHLVGVEADWQPASEQTEELGGTTHVIKVAVGVEDRGRPQTRGANPLGNPFGLLAGIDHHKFSRTRITKQNAVRLDRTDRKYIKENRDHRYLKF